jgi:hypothetical protein
MKRTPWNAPQLALLTFHYADKLTIEVASLVGRSMASCYNKAAQIGLKKSAAFLASDHAGRIMRGRTNPAMLVTQFQPGFQPWNKGTHFVAGGRSAETRFKKGERCGAANRNWVPVGSYRINGEGMLDRKITDLGKGPRDWESVARLVWKEANGPLPAGHIVAFKPGRRSTVLELITADAVEAITRAENARRNHPRNKSPELARLVQLKGAITRQVNRITKEAEQARESNAS